VLFEYQYELNVFDVTVILLHTLVKLAKRIKIHYKYLLRETTTSKKSGRCGRRTAPVRRRRRFGRFPRRWRRWVKSELSGTWITDEERAGHGLDRRPGGDDRVERTDARQHVEAWQRHLCVTWRTRQHRLQWRHTHAHTFSLMTKETCHSMKRKRNAENE